VTPGSRVLVTDASERSVLAACRGLAAAGYRVSTAAESRIALGHWSRFSNERIVLPAPLADPDGYVDRLAYVLRRTEYDVVMPGAERSLLPISERRALIEPYARLGLPPHEVVLRALDRTLVARHAAAVGLAPPPTVVCLNAEEALAAGPELGFPVVVKPARSVMWTAGGIQQSSASLAADAVALETAVAAAGVPLMIQKFVSDTTIVSFAAVRVDGALLGPTVARYARTFPPEVGSAALAVTIAPPPGLAEQVGELLGSIGWSGIFELELLQLGGGRFGAIDLNPRPFGWMGLAIAAGANLPALWCDHVLGRRGVSPEGARLGICYRWEEADVRVALTQLGRRRPRVAAALLRPHRGVVHAQFRWDDPAPLFARMLSLAKKAVGRALGGRGRTRRSAAASEQGRTARTGSSLRRVLERRHGAPRA
jgi:predicted ATP-grasp superfamily ATP-dependent carboligase